MVDKIKSLCKARGLTIASLEKMCGLGNGSIRKWDNASPSVDRAVAVANALGVSLLELTGEDNKNAPATKAAEAERKFLCEVIDSAEPEELQKIREYIEFIKSRR